MNEYAVEYVDDTESMMAVYFLAKHFGTLFLLHVHLDAYCTENKRHKACSVKDLINGFDIGVKIIDKMTEYVDKSIYPNWLFARTVDDIISLALGLKDVDLLCEIFSVAKDENDGIYLSSANLANLVSILSNNKTRNKGAPSHSLFHKDYVYSKQAIIAGLLSAGRNKIEGINNLLDVQQKAAEVVGVSYATIKKNCYDKKHNQAGVEIRIGTEGIAKRIFNKVDRNRRLPVPTALACYMVLFKALFYDYNIWTGENTLEGIPIIEMV